MMDPELMAALGGGAQASPMPGPGGAAMPMMQQPPMGGTPADAALPIVMMLQQQQAAQQAELAEAQGAELLSALAAAVGQLPNPLGAAALSEGALPAAPDALGDPVMEDEMAMGGVA